MLIKMREKRRGVGLLELMLSLALISVLLVMATRYYRQATLASKVNDAISMVQATNAAANSWVIGKTSGYTGISKQELLDQGLIPDSFGGSNANPWGGDISVSGTGANFTINLGNVPQQACAQVISKLAQTAESTSPASTSGCGNPGSVAITY